jgi:hypothetical protein
LIEEMATMKGGRGRLKKIHKDCEEEMQLLEETCQTIESVLAGNETADSEEQVDSTVE